MTRHKPATKAVSTSVSLIGISNYWFFNNVFLLKNHEFHLPIFVTLLTKNTMRSTMCDMVSEFYVSQIRDRGVVMSRAGGIYKQRRAKHTCVCEWCNHIFQATRPDAKTCCPAHRKALSRFLKDEGFALAIKAAEELFEPRTIVIKSRQMTMFAEI